MDYFKQEGNKIRAGLALDAGKLLVQYGKLTNHLPPEKKYDATLTLCVLQCLLTNCIELLAAMEIDQKAFFKETIKDVPHRWGLTRSFITCNTFPIEVTLEGVLEHLRHAVSHPTSSESSKFSSTGYTTSPDASGLVSVFRFTDSPWVKNGGEKSLALSTDKGNLRSRIKRFEKEHSLSGYLAVSPQPDGTFSIVHEGELFMPIFTIELPLPALVDLTRSLANHLAQPALEQWDGKLIHQLVA